MIDRLYSRRWAAAAMLMMLSACVMLLAGCVEESGVGQLTPPGPFSIRGQALNSLAANAPLPGFTIAINGRPDLNAVTDANGNFTINNVPVGLPEPLRLTAGIGVLSFNSNNTFTVSNLTGPIRNLGAIAFAVPNPPVPNPPNL